MCATCCFSAPFIFESSMCVWFVLAIVRLSNRVMLSMMHSIDTFHWGRGRERRRAKGAIVMVMRGGGGDVIENAFARFTSASSCQQQSTCCKVCNCLIAYLHDALIRGADGGDFVTQDRQTHWLAAFAGYHQLTVLIT